MHQLTPEDELLGVNGEVVLLVKGRVEAGENVSGLELGFRIGEDEEEEEDDDDGAVGIVGTKFGTVVMGVVMSLLVVEMPCDGDCLFVLLLEPVGEN